LNSRIGSASINVVLAVTVTSTRAGAIVIGRVCWCIRYSSFINIRPRARSRSSQLI